MGEGLSTARALPLYRRYGRVYLLNLPILTNYVTEEPDVPADLANTSRRLITVHNGFAPRGANMASIKEGEVSVLEGKPALCDVPARFRGFCQEIGHKMCMAQVNQALVHPQTKTDKSPSDHGFFGT